MFMAKKTEKTYLRTGRLKAGLLQVDVAALLGESPARISHLERRERLPVLDEVLLLQVVYETGADILLGHHTKNLYQKLRRRARAHLRRISKDPGTAHKNARVQSLERIITFLP